MREREIKGGGGPDPAFPSTSRYVIVDQSNHFDMKSRLYRGILQDGYTQGFITLRGIRNSSEVAALDAHTEVT